MTDVMSFIDGRRVQGGDATLTRRCPANHDRVVAEVALADADTYVEACRVAQAAQPGWRDVPAPVRGTVIRRLGRLIEDNKEALARIMVTEIGKPIVEARGEVQEAIDTCDVFLGEGRRPSGHTVPSEMPDKHLFTYRRPVGVVAVTTAGNFPTAVPSWYLVPALLCGNAAVWKPAEYAARTAAAFTELFVAAGVPAGVLNLVVADGPTTENGLTRALDQGLVDKVGFTGSVEVGRRLGRLAGEHLQTACLELGGKNPLVVLPDADLDLAADAAVNAGFGSAGERCMAISALVAVDPIGDELVQRIVDRMGKLRTGDGRRGCDMGPLVTAAHRDRVASYLDIGAEEGATVAVDGRDVGDVDGDADGFWLKPSLLDHVTPTMRVYTDEIFGPVLSVLRASSYDEGLGLINANPYGNGTAVFTNDGGAARRFREEVQVGMIGINVPIPVPMAYYSFGGWKASLFGDTHAHGADGVHFYTRGKVVTSRWLDPSHGGLNLGFPQHD